MKYRNLLNISIFFLLWRLFDFIIIVITPMFLPFLGFFPYQEVLTSSNLPDWLYKLASFDGAHYILIARQGYMQYEQAFFPLYPALIKLLNVINNPLLTGLIISNICFLIGLFFFHKYLKLIDLKNQQYNNLTILLFILFPTSFFFGAVYTEGLFFMLVVLVIYFLKKNNYGLVSVFAILASLTRLVGVFLIIPILLHLIKKIINNQLNQKTNWLKLFNYKRLLVILSPIIGLFSYCLYLYISTGDWLFFLSSQPAFGANRSSNLILLPQVIYRYIKIFITANHDFRYFVSMIEFIFFFVVFIVLLINLLQIIKIKKNQLLIKNYDSLGLNLFSLANLILPTLTGTFSSIPRYSLLSLSFFIYLAQIKNILIKKIAYVIFIILHIILLSMFSQGYFIS